MMKGKVMRKVDLGEDNWRGLEIQRGPIDNFIKMLTDLKNAYPGKQLIIGSEGKYDEFRWVVLYEDDETDEECAAREKKERLENLWIQKQQEMAAINEKYEKQRKSVEGGDKND